MVQIVVPGKASQGMFIFTAEYKLRNERLFSSKPGFSLSTLRGYFEHSKASLV